MNHKIVKIKCTLLIKTMFNWFKITFSGMMYVINFIPTIKHYF